MPADLAHLKQYEKDKAKKMGLVREDSNAPKPSEKPSKQPEKGYPTPLGDNPSITEMAVHETIKRGKNTVSFLKRLTGMPLLLNW